MKIAFRYIYQYEKSIDVVNDGFVKLFSHFEKFKIAGGEEENKKLLMGYIKKIMVNCAIDALRKENMIPEIGGFPDSIWDFTNKEHNADQQLLYKQLIMMIKELPPTYRIVFNMYVIDGFNHIEIADILQIPVGTSKSNLLRARTILQTKIKKSEEIKYAAF